MLPRLEKLIQLLSLACYLFFGAVSSEKEIRAEVRNKYCIALYTVGLIPPIKHFTFTLLL